MLRKFRVFRWGVLAFALLFMAGGAQAYVNEIQIYVAKSRLGQCGRNWDPDWRSPFIGEVFVAAQRAVQFNLKSQADCDRITRVTVDVDAESVVDVLVVMQGTAIRMSAPLRTVAANRVWRFEFFNDSVDGGVISTDWPQQGNNSVATAPNQPVITVLPDGRQGGQAISPSPQPGPVNPGSGYQSSGQPVDPGGRQTSLPAPSLKLIDNWNTAACNFTNETNLALQRDTRLDRLELWYAWSRGEGALPFEIVAANGTVYNGNLMRGSCDPYQAQWCVATDAPRIELPAGNYSVRVATARLCQNAGSAGAGFVRAFGSQR